MVSRTAARGHPVDEQLSTSLNSLSVNGSSSGSHSGGASQLSNSLQGVVTGLMQYADTQAAAVAELAAIVDQAEGVTAAAVGKAIRDFGAFERLLELLERPETVTEALRVIGNLASNAVDPSADETKRLLHEMGAFPRILRKRGWFGVHTSLAIFSTCAGAHAQIQQTAARTARD